MFAAQMIALLATASRSNGEGGWHLLGYGWSVLAIVESRGRIDGWHRFRRLVGGGGMGRVGEYVLDG